MLLQTSVVSNVLYCPHLCFSWNLGNTTDYLYTMLVLCLTGGEGTSWATWNPRGKWNRPPWTQSKVCLPAVLENCVMRAIITCLCAFHPVWVLPSAFSRTTGGCRFPRATRASRSSRNRWAWTTGELGTRKKNSHLIAIHRPVLSAGFVTSACDEQHLCLVINHNEDEGNWMKWRPDPF